MEIKVANLDQNIVLKDPFFRLEKNKYLQPYKVLVNTPAKGAMMTQPNIIFENEGVNYSPGNIKPKTCKSFCVEFEEKNNITDKEISLHWTANASNMKFKKGELNFKLNSTKIE